MISLVERTPSDLPRRNAADQVAVIVVNWNGWQLCLDCLASLRRSEGVGWHLYLIDNASTDGSPQHLRDLGDDVTVILSDINGGWTGGNNLGVKRALADGHQRLFILNSDAQVRPDTLAKLVHFGAGRSPPPLVGPVHRSMDETHLNFVGAQVDPRSGIPRNLEAHEVDFDGCGEAYDTAYIRGAAIFASRVHFDQLGLFDDRYYLNFDESDWCFRAREAGFPVLMLKTAEILHLESASIGGGASPLNTYFIIRNGLLFGEAHCTARQRLSHARDVLRSAMYALPYTSRARRLLGVMVGRSPAQQAFRMAVRDYALRRFGNCPPKIRALNPAWRDGSAGQPEPDMAAGSANVG